MGLAFYPRRYAEFVGNVATLMTGRAVAAAIALIVTPIVARLFEPGDYGVAAVFSSIVGITASIGSLTYGGALVIPKREEEALELLGFSYRVVLLFCSAMLFLITILKFSWPNLKPLEVLGSWAWLLPLGTLLMATVYLQGSWLLRNRKFGTISGSLVSGNAVASGARIAAGWTAGSSVFGLIFSQLLGSVTRLVFQWRTGRVTLRATFARMGFGSMRRIAKRYADFPLLNAPSELVYLLGQNLPVLLLGSMYSPAVAGFYAMAHRLSSVPITIGAAAIRGVFLQKAASIHNAGRPLGKALLLTVTGLAAIGFLPCLLVWYFGELILTWLLGERWAVAGQYLEIFAPWMFILWVTAPCHAVFIVLRRQKLRLGLQSALTVLRLTAFGVGFAINASPEWTLGAFVAATILGDLATLMIVLRLTIFGRSEPSNVEKDRGTP